MSATTNLNGKTLKLHSSRDSVVIRHIGYAITGGRSLDVSDYDGEVIYAGHIIVRTLDEDGVNYTYKPLGVTDGAYNALGENEEYAGVVIASKPVEEPMVAIMDDGRVNDKAMPYPLTDDMRTALKTALPNLIFEHD